jgi:electron-transferring-flavoprotein dehydrogenase
LSDHQIDGEPRERMDFDCVIVGAGPAGLTAAIRLKQLDSSLSVVVLEKGSEVGAHILSGAVIDPVALDQLLPSWREEDTPLRTPVTSDRFVYLSQGGSVRLPGFIMPPMLSNEGNFVVSLGNMCRWLAGKAEALGVEIYPGFAAASVVYDDQGRVTGVATGDMGIGRDGEPKATYARGVEVAGKYVLIAEGVRGSLARQLIARFNLDEGRDPPKFGLGIKELWEVDPALHQPGFVQHSFGWPLGGHAGGGSFIYHLEERQVAVGFVTHLDYANPYLSPYEEFQRFKTHPAIRGLLKGAKRLAYGARAITSGGWQSVPKLTFPGGALVGCAAGLVNLPRIKGAHNAMASGALAAEHVAAALGRGEAQTDLVDLEKSWRTSSIGKDLRSVRNIKPLWSRYGLFGGVVLGGLDMWTNALGFSLFGTLHHSAADHKAWRPAAGFKPIDYPKPDSVVTFDRMTSVSASNTNHEEDQPVHLKVADPGLQTSSEHGVYGGPSARYCPAGVYEWLADDDGKPRFVINAQNCVHCKTCDIVDPNQNITWTTPEGGGGPNYPNM